jgi:hypothetical protein
MKQTLYLSYYASLFTALAVAVGMTIYQGSMSVYSGQKLARLETQKKSLIAERQSLAAQWSTQVSLATVNQVAQSEGFIGIAQPLTLSLSNTVASR